MKELKVPCPLCRETGEYLVRVVRVLGYTLTDGETIEEHLKPCPLCKEDANEET